MHYFNKTVERVAGIVKERMSGEGTGHDWWHVVRVFRAAQLIAKGEKDVDVYIVEMAALVHDIGDYKLSESGEEIAADEIRKLLQNVSVTDEMIGKIVDAVDSVSFSKNVHRKKEHSLEGKIVQDADRLDAIGAIGIARAFAFGGAKNRLLYDPEVKPKTFQSMQDRRTKSGSTINHFYEKLLLIKDSMQTATGKELAQKRHAFMEQYLKEFYAEWDGNV